MLVTSVIPELPQSELDVAVPALRTQPCVCFACLQCLSQMTLGRTVNVVVSSHSDQASISPRMKNNVVAFRKTTKDYEVLHRFVACRYRLPLAFRNLNETIERTNVVRHEK